MLSLSALSKLSKKNVACLSFVIGLPQYGYNQLTGMRNWLGSVSNANGFDATKCPLKRLHCLVAELLLSCLLLNTIHRDLSQ
jgi:hypothetical protein